MYGAIGYGPLPLGWIDASKPKKEVEEEEIITETPVFKLITPPSQLEHLNIIWAIALKC